MTEEKTLFIEGEDGPEHIMPPEQLERTKKLVQKAAKALEESGMPENKNIQVEIDRIGDVQKGTALVPVEALGNMIAEMIRPVMQTIGKMLENNASALEQLSAAQSVQNDRLEALEKQIRLQTPITTKQAQYLNDAIRGKARELLDKRGLADDKKAVTKLGNAIRKDVLARYGIAGLREIPRHEYNVAMNQIDMWSKALTIMDIVREARGREEDNCE